MHIEGVLHLAALGVGVSVAYVGLDRIRPSEEKLEREIALVKDTVSDLLMRMDVMPSEAGHIDQTFKHWKLYVLYHVAGIKVKKGWRKLGHTMYKQKYVPLLNYFRHRNDMATVGLLSAISMMMFIYLSAAATWKDEVTVNETFMILMFVWYVILLGWITITVYASRKLFGIRETCEMLMQDVENYIRRTAEASLRAANGLPAYPRNSKPPSSTRH